MTSFGRLPNIAWPVRGRISLQRDKNGQISVLLRDQIAAMKLKDAYSLAVKRLYTIQETWVRSLGREVPWRRKRQPTPVPLPRKSNGRRSLASMGSQRVGHDWATSLSLLPRQHVKKQRHYFDKNTRKNCTKKIFTTQIIMMMWSLI